MKLMKRLAAGLLVLCLALSLSGCGRVKEIAKNTLAGLLGADSSEEEQSDRQYATQGGSITLPEGMDSTARFATQPAANEEGLPCWYVVFNGIRNRDTAYFTAPDGSLRFTCKATGESPKLKYVKIAVWQKQEGYTQYVPGTTVYVELDNETRTFALEGLDPEQQYRLTISYDSSYYNVYGVLRVDGAA